MTRLAILADIHGNLPALDAVIDDMQQFAVDRVIVAGDSIYWGPYSAALLDQFTDDLRRAYMPPAYLHAEQAELVSRRTNGA